MDSIYRFVLVLHHALGSLAALVGCAVVGFTLCTIPKVIRVQIKHLRTTDH